MKKGALFSLFQDSISIIILSIVLNKFFHTPTDLPAFSFQLHISTIIFKYRNFLPICTRSDNCIPFSLLIPKIYFANISPINNCGYESLFGLGC